MKHSISLVLFAWLLSATFGLSNAQAAQGKYNIIPEPETIIAGKGTFTLSNNTNIFAKDKDAISVAAFFAKKINTATGFSMAVNKAKKKNSITLLISKKIKGDEAYTLNVTSKGVVAKASTARGLFYAMQSFMQLLPPQIESKALVENTRWEAPAVSIKDKPRFAYRGVMLDVCRHFFPVEMIKHQIDVLSMYKINNIQLHLTEDQGWRMEIKKYPLLTQVGAWRTDDAGNKYGGYYTQEQLKDIVKYATEHFINIVPELEMPGHELAAIASYPWLSCRNVKTSPRAVWGIEDVVMCPGKETTFNFLQDVIDEMVKIFPSPYYHIGGDESPRVEWTKCPLCQKRITELGLKDEKDRSKEAQLQSYIVGRMEKYLNNYGKSIIGWDEILEGGNLNKTAIVMSWRGEKGGIAGAKAGHRVIMTPGQDGLYMDHFQGDPLIEPYAIGGYTTLEKTYNYDPVPAEIAKEGKQNLIWGPQCNVWSEYINTSTKFDYLLYPRGIALAEIAWSQKSSKNFKDFCRRLDYDGSIRLKENDVNFHIPLPEQPEGSCDYIAFTDQQTMTFKTTRPEKMVYTLDGTLPTINSTEYMNPLHFDKSAILKIASVLPAGYLSSVRTIYLEKQILAEPICTGTNLAKGLTLKIAHGIYNRVEDLANVEKWEQKNILSLRDIVKQTNVPDNLRNIQNYSAIAEGKIMIPADAVYYFRSCYPQVWIDGQKVVDQKNCTQNHHDQGGGSIALKAGLHSIRVIFLGHILDGYPSWWLKGPISIRQGETGSFKEISPEMLFK